MAQFRYLGEPHFPFVETMGKSEKFKIPKKNGTVEDFPAPNPETGWTSGEILTVTDEHQIRILSVDPRFELVS